jgi:hypothetical protein
MGASVAGANYGVNSGAGFPTHTGEDQNEVGASNSNGFDNYLHQEREQL